MKLLVIIIVFFALFGPSMRENSSLGWREPNEWDGKEVGFPNALITPDRQTRSPRLDFANHKTADRQANDLATKIWDRADPLKGVNMAVPHSNIDHNSRINAVIAQIAAYKDSLRLLSRDVEKHKIEIGIMKGRIAGLEIWLAGEKAKIAWMQMHSQKSPAALHRTLPILPLQ